MKKKLLCLFLLLHIITSNSQNTVGTTFITEDVYDAFTLISANTKAYLINNCGEVVNEWTSAYIPGNAVYLLPNGNLLRAGRVQDNSSDIVFGGQGGIVELFDWDGNLIWSFLYNSNQERQHHDVFPMPNGNVLILAATVISSVEAILAGRDPNSLPENRLYNEQIIEVEPIGTNQANIVWEWNVKDHLIQDIDNSKDNIENRMDGACSRYLNDRRKFKVMPHCLFVHGDSSRNIRNTDAIETEKNKQITKAVFGEGPKEKDKLGMGVYKQYGKGSEGFNVSSCQFALHYFFKDKRDLNNRAFIEFFIFFKS